MVGERTCVLSIAGFDPSGGAGILADIKTFETNKVCGMGAITALTLQNDIEFDEVNWIDTEEILKQISVLRRRFQFDFIKIGLIRDLDTLASVVTELKSAAPDVCIIWDPIIKASAGFEFHKRIDKAKLYAVLQQIYLTTPNTNEVKFLTGITNEKEAAGEIADHCHVLLKGGHSEHSPGIDFLYSENTIVKITPTSIDVYPKHGSGCVLSSAITAELAKGNDLITSCSKAKKYTEQFLASSFTLIGTHYV